MKNLMLTAIAASLLASCSTLTSDEAREFQTSMEKANAATQEHADAFYNALNDDFAFYNGATGGLWPKSEITVTPDWFDEDTTYSEFLSTHESGNVVSAFGKGVSKYGMFEINTRFHALYTKADDGSVNWLRNMAINEHLLAFRWMDLSIKDDDRFSELFQGMARSATTLRFATAAAYSDSLASEYPDYAPAHFGHFLKAWQDNDESGMLELVESISGKLDNENHAETEWMMGITADSREMRTYHWQNALNLSPNAPLITVFYSFNQPNVAVKEAVVRRVLERHPGNAGLCNVMGYILMGQDKMEEAKEYFEFNMTFHDDLANSFDSMGDWYAKNGDSENALEMFQKAADMDPDNFTFDASRAEE
jgi:hypothetical protein